MRNKRRLQVTASDIANRRRRLKRRVVLVLREINPTPGMGARRTLVYIARSENELDAMKFARQYVERSTCVMTDEGVAFSPLSGWCKHLTVMHSREYVTKDGTSDNQAESFYSRMRRAEYGVHHGFRPLYLIDYAAEHGWREDNRRRSSYENFTALIKMALRNGYSRGFAGYFQGNRRLQEFLGPADAAICKVSV